MDTAVSVLQSIYDVYKTIKDGQEQFASTYERMSNLLGQLRSMEASDTLVQNQFLEKYLVLARGFLAYLEKYKKRKFFSKVIHQSEMLAEVEGFNQELEALFQHFHLAMGSHIVEHNRAQEASIDELVRGMRVLLQGANTGHQLKVGVSSDDLLGDANVVQSTGPVAQALAQCDVMRLVGFFCDSADANQAEEAAMALCELAEQDAMRDAIVQAGAIPSLVAKLNGDRPTPDSAIRVHAARTLRRLAVRDIYEAEIVEAGAVPRLAALLAESATATEMEVNAAAAALGNLTSQAQHKVIIAQTPQLLARVVELVRIGSASQKKHATNILRELANNEECATAIREAHGVTALVDLLHIGSDEQCSSALNALWNLASREKNRTEIAAVGGVNAIVAQIRRGTTEEQRQLAASTLAVMAQDDANDTLIGAAGGVELLVTLLRTGTDGQKNSAAWALSELANDATNASAMVRAGVAPALMAAFRSGTDIQRAKAGLALVWIAQLTEEKETLVNEIGLSSIVSMLRGSLDQKQNAAGIIVGIAEDEDIQGELGQLGAVELLVDLLDKHAPKCTAAEALDLLAQNNEANRDKISEIGGIEIVINVLTKLKSQSSKDANDAYTHVLTVLFALCCNTVEMRLQVIAAGGLAIVLDDMEHGTMEVKRLAARLLLQLSEETPADDESGSLNATVRAFLNALQVKEGDELDDELAETALNGLTWVTTREEGMDILGDESLGGIPLMLNVMSSDTTDGNKESAGFVLGNMAPQERLAKAIVDAGALKTYMPMLISKEPECQIAAVYGLAIIAAHEELRKPIAKTTNLMKRVVKLLQTGANADVRRRAAETLWCLAMDETIAAEIGLIHGIEAMVSMIQDGEEDESYNAALALRTLANASDNIDVLIEIGAIDAAVAMVSDGQEETQLAGLELLEIMSTNREAGELMIGAEVVAQCVTALQSESEEWKELGLKILTNLNELQTTEDPEADEDSDEEDEEEQSSGSGDGEDDDEEDDGEDEEDENDDDDEEDDEEVSFLGQIIDAGGLEPLAEMLEEREAGARVGLIKLLNELVAFDTTAKLKVGGSVSFLVEVVREGNDGEQIAAAAMIVSLIDGSKRNTAAAIRARVGDAFVHMVTSNSEDIEVAKASTSELIAKLKVLKTADATGALKKLVKALAVAAVADPEARSEAAFDLLTSLLSASSFAKTFVDAGAAPICLNALKEVSGEKPAETVTRALALVNKVSRTKSKAKLVDGGVVDTLTALLKATPPESPLAVTATETLTLLGASAY